MKTIPLLPALSLAAAIGLTLTSVSASAQSYQDANDQNQSRQSCSSEVRNDRTAGTVIGALAGGLIGNAFSHGQARGTGTALGVVAGGVIGNNLGQSHGKFVCGQDRVATNYDSYEAYDDGYDRPVIRERVIVRPDRVCETYETVRVYHPHHHYARVIYRDVYRDRDRW